MEASALLLPPLPTAHPDQTDADVRSGAEGNARLTAALGLLLTVLLLAEGVTLLSVRRLITAHIAIGLMLVAPVAVKSCTTTYRFARYYLADRAYVRRGPPPIVLRLIGPLVVLSTLALLGTGVALLFRRPGSAGLVLQLHRASFIAWAIVMTVHFLGHVVEAVGLTARDLSSRRTDSRSRSASVPGTGRGLRLAVLVLTLVTAVGTAAVITPGNAWSSHPLRYDRADDHGAAHRHR